jgi:dienelactone hydrolase
LKKRLSELLGGFPGQRCQLNPEVLERVETGGCVREKVVIESDEGCLVPMYVFVPQNGDGPFAPVVAVHGHGRGMRDTAGVWVTDEERQAGTETHHDYARCFAERGYMVFAPEMIGFGERREDEDKRGESDKHSCRILSWHAAIIGKTAIGLRVWDTMRVIDYAETRGECDAKKGVGCVGLSGGGTVTLYTSAVDERIRCAVVSGYYNTFEDSILAMEHCDCNYIPGIRRYAEMPDVAALIAPRPLLVESGTMDEIFPIDATRAAYKRLMKAYEILNAGDRLDMDIGEGGHRFYGNKAFDWMGKWLAARK